MEPDVLHMYSSSPPPLEDGADEDDDEFSDFSGVPNSVSFSEFETPATFNQLQALNATSPPELIGNGRVVALNRPVMANGSQGDVPACRTVSVEELKKVAERPRGPYTNFSDFPGNTRTGRDAVDCNGGGSEVLTNGFANFDTEGTPPLRRIHRETGSSGGRLDDATPSDIDEDFADFAAFSNADVPGHIDGDANWENSNHDARLAQDNQPQSEENHRASLAGGAVDNDKDDCVTGFTLCAKATDHLSNGDRGFHAEPIDRDNDPANQDSNTTEFVSTERISQNGVTQDALEVKEKTDNRVSPVSVDERGSSGEPTEEKGSGNDTETETETETSFGRPLSTEALEEFGDFSTTGSVPSPPLQEETTTPADHSQLVEDDDEDFGDFGDFGDASSFGGAGFADFDQQGAAPHSAPAQPVNADMACADEDEFGDFDTHGRPEGDRERAEGAGFPGSDSFADFTSAPVGGAADDGGGWQAFGELNEEAGESWAAFGQDQGKTFEDESNDHWHESQAVPAAPPTDGDEERRKDRVTVCFIEFFCILFIKLPFNFFEVMKRTGLRISNTASSLFFCFEECGQTGLSTCSALHCGRAKTNLAGFSQTSTWCRYYHVTSPSAKIFNSEEVLILSIVLRPPYFRSFLSFLKKNFSSLFFLSIQESLVSRLEKLFVASFIEISLPRVEEDVPPLKAFLEPCEGSEKNVKQPAPVSGYIHHHNTLHCLQQVAGSGVSILSSDVES